MSTRLAQLALLATSVALINACGGGGGGSAAPSPPPPAPAPPAAPVPPAPPPAPAPSPNLDLSLTSPTGGTQLPFTVGQALREGAVPNGQVLTSGEVPNLQTVVRNRWPDGSAKFVLLSGKLDLTANTWRTIGLAAGTAPAGAAVSINDLKATGITASVQFASFGTASWSAGDWDTPTQTIASGPQMSSWVFRKPIGSDPHLVAWLEVRAYQGGQIEVLPWIENGTLRVAGPTSKSGTASFTLGGSQRFSQSLALLHHQRAVLASGSTFTHWLGNDPAITPRSNTAYLMSTKLVPHYRGSTAANSTLFASLPTSYTPVGQASYPDAMGAAGYDRSIGLLPQWDAAYLTSGGDPRAYRAVVINAYTAGRYATHYRDEATQRPLAFATYPDLVLSGTGPTGVSDAGASTTNTYTPTPSGTSPPNFANSHHPSMGYLAYLLTGWHYHAEETQFTATLIWLKQNDNTRQYAKGVIETITGANTTRGAAWSLRTIAQAATATPDADPLRAQFVAMLDHNIEHYHGRYVATPNNPLGLVEPYSDYVAGDPWESAIWMDDFFTAACGYLRELKSHTPSQQARLDAFLAWKYVSIVGRLGSGAAGSFNYRYAARYTVNYAPSATANFRTGVGTWYANWGAVATAMAIPAADGGNALMGDSGGSAASMSSGYWGNLQPALAYAVDHGAAGAADAYDRLVGASNFTPNATQFNDTPEWGIKPRTR